jgi:hypothetical protein
MQQGKVKNRNIFCKKYANCKGQSKEAKENRKKNEIKKLMIMKNNARSKVIYEKVNKRIKELLKTTNGKLTNEQVNNVIKKVKSEVK